MRKALTKIIGTTIGFAMAVGVAVGVSRINKVTPVSALTSAGSATITLGSAAVNRWAVGQGSGTNTNSTANPAWAKPNPDSGTHTYTDVTSSDDANGQKWTATYSYTGAFSCSRNGGDTPNVQFGKSSNPPTTLTFVSSPFSQAMILSSFNCKYGGAAASSTVSGSLYVDTTSIASGNLNTGTGTTTVSYTAGTQVVPAGSVLKVVFNDMLNGIKVYNFSYTLAASYSVTYQANGGSGSDYVVDNILSGSTHTLVSVSTAGFSSPAGKQFKCWSLSSVERNPGYSFSVIDNSTVLAVWEDIPEEPTISITSSLNLDGYTGETFSVTATYANLTSDFAWGSPTGTGSISGSVTASSGTARDGTSTFSGTLTGAGSVILTTSGGGVVSAPSVAFSITASSVVISGLSSTDTVYIGENLNLGSTITVTPFGTLSNSVSWESDDESVATVNDEGVVTGVAAGTANITVTSDDYPSATMTCAITVSRNPSWNTDFKNTMVADIILPDAGDTAEKYYVVARINEITNATFGNANVVDEEGTEFTTYGMYSFNGVKRYDAMSAIEKPVAGDIVVLYGVFTKYSGNPQIKSARVVQRNGIVLFSHTLDLSTDTTTSASTTLLTWNETNKFAMQIAKGSATTDTNNYYPGTSGQSYTSTRFYKNSVLTFTPASSITATKVEFTATTAGYATAFANSSFTNATASASGSLVTVSITNPASPFSVTIGNTCGFSKVELFYTQTAKQAISTIDTRTNLAYKYNYNGSLTFTGAAIRFGGFINEELWGWLDTNSNKIIGYGVMFAVADLGGYSIEDWYDLAKDGHTIDEAIEELVDEGDPLVKNFYHPVPSEMPDEANASQKGELVGDYFVWNLFKNISTESDDNFVAEYTAVAYIRTTTEIIFFKETTTSVSDLADALRATGEYDDDYLDGSLKYLADLND